MIRLRPAMLLISAVVTLASIVSLARPPVDRARVQTPPQTRTS